MRKAWVILGVAIACWLTAVSVGIAVIYVVDWVMS